MLAYYSSSRSLNTPIFNHSYSKVHMLIVLMLVCAAYVYSFFVNSRDQILMSFIFCSLVSMTYTGCCTIRFCQIRKMHCVVSQVTSLIHLEIFRSLYKIKIPHNIEIKMCRSLTLIQDPPLISIIQKI